MKTDYDVIIIGGGPAGSTAATILADAGKKVLIIERGQFPRFHIGESLMPETYWVFKRIGMLDKLKASAFVRKYSVQFVTASGKESQPFFFDEMNPHECSVTWQVVRSEFDKMMLENAREHGAEVWEGSNVVDVLMEPAEADDLPRAVGVVVESEGTKARRHEGTEGEEEDKGTRGQGDKKKEDRSEKREARSEKECTGNWQLATGNSSSALSTQDSALLSLRAKVVIDATGTNAMLARKLGIKKPDPKLRKASYFAHYKGGRRDPGKNAGATLVLSTATNDGWFWYIPLPDDIVSVGVVGDLDRFVTQYKSRGCTPEQILEEEIRNCRGLDDRMTAAARVSPVHVLSDFSYRATRCAGEGWVLIGDAFGFLDPMYSSGVFLALKSGQMAADAVIEAFEKDDFSAEQLSKWGDALSGGMQSIRKLVYAFYTRDFSFGKFVREYPDARKNLVDLLIGNVFYEGVDEIFEPMSQTVELPAGIPLERPAGSHVGAGG